MFLQSFLCLLFLLGVLDAEGTYIVGGHLGGNQVKPAAGTVIHYTHRRSKAGKDRIAIVGPTNALLRVMVSERTNILSNEMRCLHLPL